MAEQVENHMVVDALWPDNDLKNEDLPRCECCEETIGQATAVHMLSGKRWIWLCDRCIEDLKELTGYEE